MTYSWTAPPVFINGTGDGPTASDLDALANDLAFLHQEFPIRIEGGYLWHPSSNVIAGNALAVTVTSSQRFGFYAYQNASANGDSFEQSFLLAAGTYTVYMLGRVIQTGGNVDWELDGTTIDQGQQWYAAAAAYNQEKTIASVVVAENGRHVLTATVNGKHASSSGYDVMITAIWFIPTGGDVV